MRIALISDIHSNIEALKSVISDIETRNVDRIISTGDLVGYLPYPNEVIDYFKKYSIESVIGNNDKKVSEHVFDPKCLETKTGKEIQSGGSLLFTSKTITEDNRAYLRKLPERIILEIDGMKLLFVHGSPRAIDEYLYEEDDELLETFSEKIEEDVLVFGHTHIPFHKIVNNKHFINAGSVGKPKHGNASSTYVVIDVEDGNISAEIFYVTYDISELCAEIRKNRMIADHLIDNITNGK